jgi:hypothetical protein
MKILIKYKYILIIVIFFILIAFVNIPFVREGLTGMSQYQYLAPLPENYAANNGIDEAYLTKFYTYQQQVINDPSNNSSWTPNTAQQQTIQQNVQAYLNNKPQSQFLQLPYKEEMDFFLTNGYFPYNQFLMNFFTQLGQPETPPMTAQQMQQSQQIKNYSNRGLFVLYTSIPSTLQILKTIDGYNEAYQIFMGTSTPSTTSTTSTTTTSTTTSGTPVTLNDFLNLCKRATSSQ